MTLFIGTHTSPDKDTGSMKVSGSFEMNFETGEVTLKVDT